MIKVGDTVILHTETRPVKRVGYRLHKDEVNICDDPVLKAFAGTIPLHWHVKVRGAIANALRMQYVYSREFGGRDRVVVRDESPACDPLMPGQYVVLEKKVKLLGNYHPPSRGYDHYGGGHWYDPGYLSDRKCVQLLYIRGEGDAFGYPTGWVTSEDIELAAKVDQAAAN